MKALLNLIFLLILPSFIQAQSNNYINKHTVQIELSTKILLTDSVSQYDRIISCQTESYYFFLHKKRIIIYTQKYHFDLKVLSRKKGYWICRNATGDYYAVSPFQYGESYGLIFQPIKENKSLRYDLQTYVVCNRELCK